MSTSTLVNINKFGAIYKLSLDTSAVIIDQTFTSGQDNLQQYIRIIGGNSTANTITINDGSTDYAPIYVASGVDLVFAFTSGVGAAATIKADAAGPFNYNAFVTYVPEFLSYLS